MYSVPHYDINAYECGLFFLPYSFNMSHKCLILQAIFQLNQMFGFLRRTPVAFLAAG